MYVRFTLIGLQVQLADILQILVASNSSSLSCQWCSYYLPCWELCYFSIRCCINLISWCLSDGTLRHCTVSKAYHATISNWIYPTLSSLLRCLCLSCPEEFVCFFSQVGQKQGLLLPLPIDFMDGSLQIWVVNLIGLRCTGSRYDMMRSNLLFFCRVMTHDCFVVQIHIQFEFNHFP